MKVADQLLRELEHEEKTTRRVLERVPPDKLNWKPHEKSMSLGQLAQHVASTPGGIASSSVPDSYPVENFHPDSEPTGIDAILQTHQASMETARSVLAALDEARAVAPWTMTAGGQPILTMPRIEWLRV